LLQRNIVPQRLREIGVTKSQWRDDARSYAFNL
jgi:hypothetical protein